MNSGYIVVVYLIIAVLVFIGFVIYYSFKKDKIDKEGPDVVLIAMFLWPFIILLGLIFSLYYCYIFLFYLCIEKNIKVAFQKTKES